MVSLKIERRGDAAKRISMILDGLQGPKRVKAGLPAGEADGDVIAIASYNEFGTRHIPERPAIRNAVRSNREDYADLCRRAAQRIVAGDLTMRRALELLGTKAQGDIQREIVALDSPPNKPETVRKKGSSNPLVDTGRYRQAITYKVED